MFATMNLEIRLCAFKMCFSLFFNYNSIKKLEQFSVNDNQNTSTIKMTNPVEIEYIEPSAKYVSCFGKIRISERTQGRLSIAHYQNW